ncbi:regulator of chromosome condensation 1/beta-lactamase-inhibitor protein II [Chytriomyces cf. hyalinus JEL632]|nr:regulator of chromosome condensation 1/beta-lactamase-inhibitor protein II [Chytriomyces cf. hyalinus JEL632]
MPAKMERPSEFLQFQPPATALNTLSNSREKSLSWVEYMRSSVQVQRSSYAVSAKVANSNTAEDSLMKSFGKRPNDYSLRESDLASCKTTSVSQSTFSANKAAVAAEPQSKPPGKLSNLNSESLQKNQKAERRLVLSLQSATVFQTSPKPHARTPPLAASLKTFNTHTVQRKRVSRRQIFEGLETIDPIWAAIQAVFSGIYATLRFSSFVDGIHSDEETRIYACGGNGYGELGTGDFEIKWHLSEVESMRGQLQHTVLLRKDGSVWVAGRGHNGQLGLGDGVEHVQMFTRLHFPAKITSITCSTSGSQTYLISDNGELFLCGYNCYGQLVLKMDEDAIYTPHQVPLRGRTAILVSAGCQFAVLSASGK